MNNKDNQEAKEQNAKARQNSTPSGASKISYTQPNAAGNTSSMNSGSNNNK